MTEPLTPIDLDLRDFVFMPLEVVRLRDSDLAALATGDEFRAAVLLWCAAWHQVPAASLPNDDRLLAKLAGFGRDLKGWNSVKREALRGFIECTDGRLYHPVIADIAIDSGKKKKTQTRQTSNATEARKRKAKAVRDAKRDDDRNDQRDDDRYGPRNVVQGKGREEKGRERKGRITPANKLAGDEIDPEPDLLSPTKNALVPAKPDQPDYASMFEQWYAAYPKKVDRKDAFKCFERVLKKREATFGELMAGARRYAHDMTHTEPKYIKAPSVWLNKGSWANEPQPQQVSETQKMVNVFQNWARERSGEDQ